VRPVGENTQRRDIFLFAKFTDELPLCVESLWKPGQSSGYALAFKDIKTKINTLINFLAKLTTL